MGRECALRSNRLAQPREIGMRLATVEAEGKERLCLCSGQRLIDLHKLYALYAQKVGRLAPFEKKLNMMQFLELGEQAIIAAGELAKFAEDFLSETKVSDARRERIVFAAQEVRFRPPVPRPSKILCLAGNYVEPESVMILLAFIV